MVLIYLKTPGNSREGRHLSCCCCRRCVRAQPLIPCVTTLSDKVIPAWHGAKRDAVQGRRFNSKRTNRKQKAHVLWGNMLKTLIKVAVMGSPSTHRLRPSVPTTGEVSSYGCKLLENIFFLKWGMDIWMSMFFGFVLLSPEQVKNWATTLDLWLGELLMRKKKRLDHLYLKKSHKTAKTQTRCLAFK